MFFVRILQKKKTNTINAKNILEHFSVISFTLNKYDAYKINHVLAQLDTFCKLSKYKRHI